MLRLFVSLIWLPVWALIVVLFAPVWLVVAALLGATVAVVVTADALRWLGRNPLVHEELSDPVGYVSTLLLTFLRAPWWHTAWRFGTAAFVLALAIMIAPVAVLDVPECEPGAPANCVVHRSFDVAVAWAAAGWGIVAALPGRLRDLRASPVLRSPAFPWGWYAALWLAEVALVTLASTTSTLTVGLESTSSVLRGALFGAFFVALADLVVLFSCVLLAAFRWQVSPRS